MLESETLDHGHSSSWFASMLPNSIVYSYLFLEQDAFIRNDLQVDRLHSDHRVVQLRVQVTD